MNDQGGGEKDGKRYKAGAGRDNKKYCTYNTF